LIILVGFVSTVGMAQTPFDQPPSWAEDVIWYQIFVERFHNGDKKNDPKAADISSPSINRIAPEGWSTTPWTKSWYEQEPWAAKSGLSFNEAVQYRRYGGDLQGVLDKLDYLQDLGITALYLNPINHAPSLHKFDASSYHHVDANFGPDPKSDLAIMAAENPLDPSTWKWTAADKLFLKLVQEVHRRNMKIIMDFSWNHTGTRFWAWEDILKNQEKSPYKDWYAITSFDNPATPKNEFSYAGWAGTMSLPEIRKVNITTKRKSGLPYEGDIDANVKKHVYDATRRWLAPKGVITDGVDGFRLDVADEVGMVFWRDYRKFVRSIQPEAYLVGEIWWQQYPDKLMNPVTYVKGDVFDGVMFYQIYRPSRYFFAKTGGSIDAKAFRDSMQFQLKRLSPATQRAMMKVSASHDAPRLLSCFYNPNKYKFKSTPSDDPAYKTGRPDEETYLRLRLYLVSLFTGIGAPQIWNGEEMGMWGADDPHCRKPLWWQGMKFDPEARNNFQPGITEVDAVGFNAEQFQWYKKLIQMRRNEPVLVRGNLDFLVTEGKKLAYSRSDGQREIIVLLNVEGTRQEFKLPRQGNYVDLLTNKMFNVTRMWLDPYSAVVLKKL